MSALKMLLGVSSDKEVEKKLGADVLNPSDFNDSKGRPLSAFRIRTILSKVDEVLHEEGVVQEPDEVAQKQFDDFYAGATTAYIKAESEKLVKGLWKYDRRRVEDIVGTKSKKSLAEDGKILRKQSKVPNQRTTTIDDKADVGGLGGVVGALTGRAEKRAKSITGPEVNEAELDIQSQIDEIQEGEPEVAQGAPKKTLLA